MENNVLEYEKRIKILTAIGNENLNKILKEKNKFEVIENDIFYKEGILEFLEENKNIDILILYEKLSGEIYIIIFVIERRIEKIKINKKIINKLILENKINSEKINIIFNKINNYSVNKKISKNIYKKIKIIANIKLNNYPDYLMNKKNNYKVENKKLEKCYLKIIRRINV